MKVALKDDKLGFMHRCPDCKTLVSGMTLTHPWRLYCSKCKQELQNPDYPQYYKKDGE
jgi:uncharacterized paraquat-inducible protein A